jgi:hypothetical protein
LIDIEVFEERSAIIEYCGGVSRFQAETLAAEAQGLKRWEVMNEIKRRNTAKARDHRETAERNDAGSLSQLQPTQKE